jgi:signal transduction histidine kinase
LCGKSNGSRSSASINAFSKEGRDEIAILANALDAGFAAIAAQDRLKVAAEVAVTMPGRSFDVDVARGGRLLADEHLLTQAVWTLLTYAAAIAETGRKILVRLQPGGARLQLEVLFDAPSVPAEDMERAFAPFASVQYEGGSAIRNAVGLFLCREIARVHGGSLFAMNPNDVQRMLVLELPA